MHFQLWFPGQTRDAAGLLRSHGLPDFVEGAKESVDKLTPETMPGLWVTWSGNSGSDPANQTVIECGGYSIVLWKNKPCVPEDLARRSKFGAYNVLLADGNMWLIPVAAQLPATFKLSGGQWKKTRKPQFDEFWRQSEIWYRRLVEYQLDPAEISNGESIPVEQVYGEFAEFCITALRQNYRMTGEIASELGLLDSESITNIVLYVLDGIFIKEVNDEIADRSDVETAFEKKQEAPSDIQG